MAALSIETIVAGVSDPESTQYNVLACLKNARDAFSRNAIYPHLSSLVEAYNSLDNILGHISGLRDAFPGNLERIDLETGKLIYDYSNLSTAQVDVVGELIDWALPLILETIEEGRTIFEFVDGHLVLEEVGIQPSYCEEGYLLLPDPNRHSLEVVQYELSIYASATERFRTLKTTHVKTIEVGCVMPAPSAVKMDLVSGNHLMPNPATYCLRTDIDFPYESTILPIGKRKLMHRLFGMRGYA